MWRKVEQPQPQAQAEGSGGDGGGRQVAAENAATKTTAYVPRCVCALSFDPLFDTLRAVALARGGFPEEGRALMLGTGAGAPADVGGGGGPAAAASGGSDKLSPCDVGSGGAAANTTVVSASSAAGLEWGLGDTATLRVGPPPLPIFRAPTPAPASTLPSMFAPAFKATLRPAGEDETKPQGRELPLLRAASGYEWTAAWSEEVEEDEAPPVLPPEAKEGSSGEEDMGGGWSSLGFPPLMPLDHPVEPLFQVHCSLGGGIREEGGVTEERGGRGGGDLSNFSPHG